MIAISFTKHIVDEIRNTTFSLLIQFEQSNVVVQSREELLIIGSLASFDIETLLSVLQFANEPMIMRELCGIAPNEQHGADDGARLSRDDGQSRVECRLVHCPPLFVFGGIEDATHCSNLIRCECSQRFGGSSSMRRTAHVCAACLSRPASCAFGSRPFAHERLSLSCR